MMVMKTKCGMDMELKNEMKKEKEGIPFQVMSRYDVWVSTDVELPEGKTPDDIEGVWFKWGEGLIEFKDGTSIEGIEQEEIGGDYFKRPTTITLMDEEDELLGSF